MRTKRMPDVEFRRRCLEIIDEVHRTRRPIVITRDLVMLIPAGKAPSASKRPDAKKR
jgi:PHD/YefM family antitoxin component YafN of YafNO toxin-antitoxin module